MDIHAVVLCRDLDSNEDTGEYTLRGVLREVVTSELPLVLPSVYGYVSASGIYGRAGLHFVLDFDGRPIAHGDAEIISPRVGAVVEKAIAFGEWKLPGYGDYDLILTHCQEMMGRARFRVARSSTS